MASNAEMRRLILHAADRLAAEDPAPLLIEYMGMRSIGKGPVGVNIWNWYLFKNVGGDDDRWKRRKAKVAEKVAQLGSRLTVVPAGAQ